MTHQELDTFGELRSMLSRAPSELLWEQICALCDMEVAHDAARFEAELLSYVSAGLEGWPDALRTAPQGWVDAISAAGAHPCGSLVRRLARKPAGDVARLLSAPCLAQVTDLSLNALGMKRIDALAGASMLGALRVLELGSVEIEGAGAVFARLPALTALHGGDGRADRLLDALEDCGRLPALEALCLGLEEPVATLRRLRVCGALRKLTVWSRAALGDAGVAALCEAVQHAPLMLLNARCRGVSGACLAMIAAAPWRLEQLMISEVELSADAAALLGEHEAFGALRLLGLSWARLAPGALAPLLARRGEQPLRVLRCNYLNGMDAESWGTAAQGDTARGLETLVIEHSVLRRHGVFDGLVAGIDGGQMQRLSLSWNGLGAKHMKMLGEARLPGLRELDLSHNPITDAGAEALMAADWFGGLEHLDVNNCQLRKALVEKLRALPGRQLARPRREVAAQHRGARSWSDQLLR